MLLHMSTTDSSPSGQKRFHIRNTLCKEGRPTQTCQQKSKDSPGSFLRHRVRVIGATPMTHTNTISPTKQAPHSTCAHLMEECVKEAEVSAQMAVKCRSHNRCPHNNAIRTWHALQAGGSLLERCKAHLTVACTRGMHKQKQIEPGAHSCWLPRMCMQ